LLTIFNIWQSSRPYGWGIFLIFLIILLPMFGTSVQNGRSDYVSCFGG